MSKFSSPFVDVHPTLREPAFLGFDAPSRCEAEVWDCFVSDAHRLSLNVPLKCPPQIEGEVPPQIDGTFYRVAPDMQVIAKYPGE